MVVVVEKKTLLLLLLKYNNNINNNNNYNINIILYINKVCGLIIIIIVIIINITNVPDPVYNIISGQFSQAKKHLENLQMNKNTEALNMLSWIHTDVKKHIDTKRSTPHGNIQRGLPLN